MPPILFYLHPSIHSQAKGVCRISSSYPNPNSSKCPLQRPPPTRRAERLHQNPAKGTLSKQSTTQRLRRDVKCATLIFRIWQPAERSESHFALFSHWATSLFAGAEKAAPAACIIDFWVRSANSPAVWRRRITATVLNATRMCPLVSCICTGARRMRI
jgi:hypothetical protein